MDFPKVIITPKIGVPSPLLKKLVTVFIFKQPQEVNVFFVWPSDRSDLYCLKETYETPRKFWKRRIPSFFFIKYVVQPATGKKNAELFISIHDS